MTNKKLDSNSLDDDHRICLLIKKIFKNGVQKLLKYGEVHSQIRPINRKRKIIYQFTLNKQTFSLQEIIVLKLIYGEEE